jgi:hypothetical protein
MPKVNPKETTVFVTVDKQKTAKEAFKASAERCSKPLAPVGKLDEGIKMPSRWTNGGLREAETTVFAVGDDGAFDASPATAAATPGDLRAPVVRTRVRKPKAPSIQDEMLAAAAEAEAAKSQAAAEAEAAKVHCAGITVVGESTN